LRFLTDQTSSACFLYDRFWHGPEVFGTAAIPAGIRGTCSVAFSALLRRGPRRPIEPASAYGKPLLEKFHCMARPQTLIAVPLQDQT
jgi:hypothetical protein